MLFKNRNTGAVKSLPMVPLGVFIIGPLYFLFTGLVIYGVIWLIINIAMAYAIGFTGPLFANVVVAIFSTSIYRSYYTSKGWVEQNEGFIEDEAPTTRACPLCGEQIIFSAVKCKHCGSTIEAAKYKDPYAVDQPVQYLSPTGAPIGVHIERVLKTHNAKQSSNGYTWNGAAYASFNDLADAINSKISA